MTKILPLIALCLMSMLVTAQNIQLLSTGNKTSMRGLSVVTDKVIWASGSNGSVTRSVDSGKTWKWMKVPGFEKRDFRDIEAFDAVTAIIMAIDTPATILKTIDGGEHWKAVYNNNTPGMFLDAMEFWNQQSGIVVGDPINGKFFIARTFDEGNSWHATSFNKLPAADSGEGCFASSGTNVRGLNVSEAGFISGGLSSRFFWKGTPVKLPLGFSTATSGACSMAVRDPKKRNNSLYFIVVGGDFSRDTIAERNCVITKDGGKSWVTPATPPHGYRSCVEFITATRVVTCGTSGIDVSADAGMNWQAVNKESFHVCRKAKEGKAIFFAGNGRIAKLIWK